MVIGDNNTDLTTDAGIIQTYKDYKYLGIALTSKCPSEKYIISKIAQEKQALRSLNPMLPEGNKVRRTPRKIFSVQLYSALAHPEKKHRR